MRTTIRLEDALLIELRQHAAETGRTMTAVIEDSLRETLARRHAAPRSRRTTLPTCGGDGLQPGVNIDNTAELLDIMDGLRAPR